MQLGMIGLGRMGGNMVRRLMRGGHSCIVYDRSADAMRALSGEGAVGSTSLDDFVGRLDTPRIVWLMLPAALVDATIADLETRLKPGDIIIDGGNSFFRDDVDRAKRLAPRGLHYVDCGTSGGVWGLERGYCLMIGGETDVVRRLDSIFATLAPGPPEGGPHNTASRGYLHCGPPGAGHFVKMVHNGIEYGLMAAYAEGFNILKHANAGTREAQATAEHAPLRDPQVLPVRLRPGGDCRSLAPRQRGLVVAARPDGIRPQQESRPHVVRWTGVRFRRRSMDYRRGDRRGCAGGSARRGTLCEVQLARRGRFPEPAALRDALRVRRPRRAEIDR